MTQSRVYEVSRNWTGDQIIRENRRYVIEIPYLPPSKNQWRTMDNLTKSGVKKRWIRRIVAECEAQDMPKGLPKIALAAKLIFPSRTDRDIQNYAATLWEFVPDALEAKQHGTIKRTRNGQEWREPIFGYGMIPNDSAGHIEWPPDHGIVFGYDERRELPATKRRRTLIFIVVRMP
jgi:hypothetical protein